MSTGGYYLAAAYLIFVVTVLTYLVIVAAKLRRLEQRLHGFRNRDERAAETELRSGARAA